MFTSSRLLAFLAALVLTIASGSTYAQLLDGTSSAENARREIFAGLGAASSEFVAATIDRVWEKSASATTIASGPRIYAYSQVIEEYVSENGGAKRLAATFTFADDLVAQTRYTSTPTGTLTPATRIVHQDGFGSTRWLTDTSGVITDTVEYDAFGETTERSGTTEVEHLYRGEQFDAELGLYYLRARLYDPSSGRFQTMDLFPGLDMSPESLHHYNYGHRDPVNQTDPSGHAALLLQELIGLDLNMFMRTLKTDGLRRYLRKAVTETLLAPRQALRLVRECMGKKAKKCDLSVPTLLVGGDNPDAAQHILDAQLGRGSNIVPAFLLFNYVKRRKTSWYSGMIECSEFKKRMAQKEHGGQPVQCDEFPFNASRQGGKANYPMRVSLRYIPATQNVDVGFAFGQLVSWSRMKKGDKFLVVAMPDWPVTMPIPIK